MFAMQMKRVLLNIVLALFLFSGPLSYANEGDAGATKNLRIVASFYPVYIMAKNVTRDVPGISLQNLTSPLTGCLHDYSLTSNDMKKISDAQVFVANGAGMESFLDQILEQHPNLKIIRLSEGVSLIKDNGKDNPHVWVSISNAVIQVKNLGKTMEAIDPVHQELYAKNTAAYAAKLEDLSRKMHSELGSYRGRAVITFHKAFSYFAREFGFNIVAVIEREPGSEPSARELAETVELVKNNGIHELFSEPQYPAAAANVIAKETGAKIYVLDPAVTGPDDYDAYINIMENNLNVLKKAFGNNQKGQ